MQLRARAAGILLLPQPGHGSHSALSLPQRRSLGDVCAAHHVWGHYCLLRMTGCVPGHHQPLAQQLQVGRRLAAAWRMGAGWLTVT
jgi:hypothetical protein